MYSVLNTLLDIHTFAYQKILLYTLFLLVFKIIESPHCILKYFRINFINNYIILEFKYYQNNSFIRVSAIANVNQYYAMARRNKNVFHKS